MSRLATSRFGTQHNQAMTGYAVARARLEPQRPDRQRNCRREDMRDNDCRARLKGRPDVGVDERTRRQGQVHDERKACDAQ